MLDLKQINPTWTLFLDRDGVINHEKPDDYVYNYNEFNFYDGVPEALAYLAERFGKIIVVTNQRGIGRGLMTEADLNKIHVRMLQDIRDAGGRLDAIYHCPAIDDADPDRKPNPGMFFRARSNFPSIEAKRSIIVGNNLSDMEFGRNAGLHTVFVKTTHPDVAIPNPAIDAAFASLPDFAKALRQV